MKLDAGDLISLQSYAACRPKFRSQDGCSVSGKSGVA